MPRRQYLRNGTPIGGHRVYALAMRGYTCTDVFEIEPSGIETYEDLEGLVALEQMSGKFGFGYDRLVITKPGIILHDVSVFMSDLRGADFREGRLSMAELFRTDLRGADFRDAMFYGCDIRGADLRGADVRGAKFDECFWDSTTRWPEGFFPPPAAM